MFIGINLVTLPLKFVRRRYVMQTCKINTKSESLERAFLIPLNNSQDVIEIEEFCTLGRGTHNNIVITDPFVSVRHARIEKRGSQFILKDLRSSNGTLLNETPVLEAQLKSNDRIRLGECQWTFSSSRHQSQELPNSKSNDWQKQLNRIPAFASTDHTVLIIGPSGSGKEMVAKWIHQYSPRNRAPFVAINCSALSEQLIESELFGHVKGAFTGAAQDRKGAFETARGGTLFLDEIGDLPMSLQPKLLRALENQEIRAVGSDITCKTDVRVLAATHKNLYERVLKREFREDLYHRLNVCRISPPALIDRLEDFETLLYCMAKEHKVRFSYAAIEQLKNHTWPGNIRELKNTVVRASAYFPGTQITPEHLKEVITLQESISIFNNENLPPLKELERELILKSLQKFRGNQRKAAEELKMPKSTLNDKIRYYDIKPQVFKLRSKA